MSMRSATAKASVSLRRLVVSGWLALLLPACATVVTPLSEWKDRLFGKEPDPPVIIDAPEQGVVLLASGRPERIDVGASSPERKFPGGESRYRLIELPREFEHASVRVRVLAQPNRHGRGHTVFKPTLYVLDDHEAVRETREVKPLHLDIRPFRPTRLLACVKLERLRRFAIATSPAAIGESYESDVRDSVAAPSKGGFYYATDAVKVNLPYAATGTLVIEVEHEAGPSQGC
ncbi:MAG: hypothetical protein WBW61_02815 [Rhodanobacteraceae bacterium]